MRGHDSLDFLRRVFAVLALAMLWSAVPARADQILQTSSDSLTTYKYSGNTRVQGVRPRAEQRGVGFDGAQRAGGSLPWALAGNPFESAQAGETLGSLRLATGAYAPTEIDLALPAQVPWIVGRTFNARQTASGGAHLDSDGYQGRNWFQISQPEIRLYDADGNAGTKQAVDLVYLVYGADRYVEFKRTADNADTFRGVNGAAGIFKYESGSPDLYVYTDQNGNRTYFFGGNTSSGRADWQLWKFVDPAGNTAYVGHATTASTAVTNGYNTDGTIAQAFDSEGRRYCYTYSTIDSATRLTQVIAEIEDGENGWEACGEETLVGKVEYAYYSSSDNTHGPAGNLKLVTITTPLSFDPLVHSTPPLLTRKQYYRYYTQEYENSSGRRGGIGMLKLVVGFEGCRRFDWGEDGAEAPPVLDDGFLTASDTSLKPYADAYFEYPSGTDFRVWSVYFDGECGCAGGTNGQHKLTYEDNPGFSGTSGYDTAWHRRVVIEPPTGGAWVTQYLDEVGQPLSRVLTDANPANTSPAPAKWVTQVVRNSDGQVTEVHTPANVTRPLVEKTRAFHTVTTDHTDTTKHDETTQAYAWWSSTTTDVLYITIKQVTTTAPAVSTGKNGSGSATTTKRYLRKDGTAAFAESARGIFHYTAYTGGQVTKRIEDVKTNGTFPTGDDPNTDWGITESGDGFGRVTEYAYDDQGRMATEERGERRYYCQNWRADVSALLTDAGSMVEWAKHSSYGVPFALPAGDTDSDGDWDATDSAAITGTYDVRKDANLDGVINASDVTHANSITGGYQTLGRGILSSSGVANRKGYAGYEYDPTLEGAGKWLYHVRHRVYDADIGRWMRRDPIGYVDGMSLYEYVRSRPVAKRDPAGLASCATGVLTSVSNRFPAACTSDLPLAPCSPCATRSCCEACCTATYPTEFDECMARCPGAQSPTPSPKPTPPTGPADDITKCCDWNKAEKSRGTGWVDTLDSCPCTIGVPPTNPDRKKWTTPSPADPTYHPGAAHCMRSRNPGKDWRGVEPGWRNWDPVTSPGQQCCYDSKGNLITDGPGAGTPDKIAPIGPIPAWDHWDNDVAPFNWCKSAGMLDKYLEVRPPNNGNNCPTNGTPPPPTTACP